MKSPALPELAARGIDESTRPNPQSAGYIQNMRYDDKFYWVGDRGFEPLVVTPSVEPNFSAIFLQDVLQLFSYSRHNGAESYIIEKHDDGCLYVRVQNEGRVVANAPLYHKISSERVLPRPQDPGEQFIPHDRYCLILNGYDDMLKYGGRYKTYRYGFTYPTPQPEIMMVDVNYWDASLSTPQFPSPGSVAMNPQEETIGLGIGDIGERNSYKYKVTFISDTGSESPLSEAVEVTWIPNSTTGLLRYGVFFQELPIGPPGTLARRIYRTKNLRDYALDQGEALYYFVDQVNENTSTNYMDIKPDNLLFIPAPTEADSVTISNAYKYAASWNGRVWLAGKSADDLMIIFSLRGFSEQFSAENYVLLGNSSAGQVTGMIPYYDNLIIFRERSIEVVRSRGDGDTYSVSTLSSSVGTTATRTIKTIPGLGVVFLSYDGVYAVSGGTLGGSSVSVQKISEPIADTMRLLNAAALPKAAAAYSEKEDEYWLAIPTRGQEVLDLGVVLHTKINQWSIRKHHPIRDITTLPDGWFAVSFAVESEDVSPNQSPLFEYKYLGVHVWSAKPSGGTIVTEAPNVQPGGGTHFISTDDEPLEKIWESPFISFGDDGATKRITYVEVAIIGNGNNEVFLDQAIDGRAIYSNQQSLPLAPAVEYNSTSMDAILAPPSSTVDRIVATTDVSLWTHWRVTKLRFDVQTGQILSYRFRLKSSQEFSIISYKIGYISGQSQTVQVLNAKSGSDTRVR